MVNSFPTTGQRDGQPSSEVAVDNVEKNPWCLGHYSFLVRALCESVALSLYSSTGFVPQCVSTNL